MSHYVNYRVAQQRQPAGRYRKVSHVRDVHGPVGHRW